MLRGLLVLASAALISGGETPASLAASRTCMMWDRVRGAIRGSGCQGEG